MNTEHDHKLPFVPYFTTHSQYHVDPVIYSLLQACLTWLPWSLPLVDFLPSPHLPFLNLVSSYLSKWWDSLIFCLRLLGFFLLAIPHASVDNFTNYNSFGSPLQAYDPKQCTQRHLPRWAPLTPRLSPWIFHRQLKLNIELIIVCYPNMILANVPHLSIYSVTQDRNWRIFLKPPSSPAPLTSPLPSIYPATPLARDPRLLLASLPCLHSPTHSLISPLILCFVLFQWISMLLKKIVLSVYNPAMI